MAARQGRFPAKSLNFEGNAPSELNCGKPNDTELRSPASPETDGFFKYICHLLQRSCHLF